MQVEYSDRPLLAETANSDGERDDVDVPDDEEEDAPEDDVEVDVEGEGEADEGVEGAEGAPKKTRKPIRSRQSLSEKQPGTTLFPMARVKKLIKADRDLDAMSTEATFMIAVATEYFVKHFIEEGYTRARLDQRKIVTYKDMASLVARSPEFDFLRDVVPMPMSLSDALEARKAKQIRDENPDADDSTTEPAPASSSALAPSAHTPAAAPKASASSSSSKLAAYAYAPPAATARPDATQPAVPEQYDIDTRFAPDSAIGMDVDGTTAPVASTSLAHGFTGSSGVAGVGLTVSTNPMFPGAIVKRTGHSSHAGEGAGGRARSSIGRNGTTSPSTPTHSIGTRRSGRRSMVAAEEAQPVQEQPEGVATTIGGGVAVVDDDVPME